MVSVWLDRRFVSETEERLDDDYGGPTDANVNSVRADETEIFFYALLFLSLATAPGLRLDVGSCVSSLANDDSEWAWEAEKNVCAWLYEMSYISIQG